jgi:hypothetical protein
MKTYFLEGEKVKKNIIVLLVCTGISFLSASDKGAKGKGDSGELVKVHPFEGKGAAIPLGSSPSSSMLGLFNTAVHYFTTPPPGESEIERIAREMRDAVLGRNEEVLQTLLEQYGAAPAEIVGPDKHSAFHMACLNGYVRGIEILARKKKGSKREDDKKTAVNIDLLNGNGSTALQVAISSGHVDVARTLVGFGATVDYPELDLAREFRHKYGKEKGEVVRKFKELLGTRRQQEVDDYIDYSDREEDEDQASGVEEEEQEDEEGNEQ